MARILIIDDESNIRMMLKLALSHVGHTVQTAADGYEGLEQFGNGAEWDLILLDQRMPGLTGLEVLTEMRQRCADCRVLLITAFGTVDLAREAIAAGATDFLRKPFTVETLRGAVRAALQEPGGVSGSPSEPSVAVARSFETTTVNGFRIHRRFALEHQADGGVVAHYTVQSPAGESLSCRVVLPNYLIELVRAHTDREVLPSEESFWQGLTTESLANYLWQNAELPPDATLVVEDLTSGLRHWIDAILSGVNK